MYVVFMLASFFSTISFGMEKSKNSYEKDSFYEFLSFKNDGLRKHVLKNAAINAHRKEIEWKDALDAKVATIITHGYHDFSSLTAKEKQALMQEWEMLQSQEIAIPRKKQFFFEQLAALMSQEVELDEFLSCFHGPELPQETVTSSWDFFPDTKPQTARYTEECIDLSTPECDYH